MVGNTYNQYIQKLCLVEELRQSRKLDDAMYTYEN